MGREDKARLERRQSGLDAGAGCSQQPGAMGENRAEFHGKHYSVLMIGSVNNMIDAL